jgi:hypothetical protein
VRRPGGRQREEKERRKEKKIREAFLLGAWRQDPWCHAPRHVTATAAGPMQVYLGADDYGAMRMVYFLKSFCHGHI